MLAIYNPGFNKVIRTVLRPFASLIPAQYHIPIYGPYSIDLGKNRSIRFTCNPTSYLGRLLFWGGEKNFEYHVVRVFKELIAQEAGFLDIGTNIGYYSMVAKAINPSIKVVGFEPMPAAIKYFKLNQDLNGFDDIELIPNALSNEAGEFTFYSVYNPKYDKVEDHLAGDGSLNSGTMANKTSREIKVTAITLDSFLESRPDLNIGFVKLDTEASEHFVLRGASKLLSEHRPIIMCEVLKGQIESELEEIFTQADYTYYHALAKGLVEVDTLHRTDNHNDYFMVPKERISEISRFVVSQ